MGNHKNHIFLLVTMLLVVFFSQCSCATGTNTSVENPDQDIQEETPDMSEQPGDLDESEMSEISEPSDETDEDPLENLEQESEPEENDENFVMTFYGHHLWQGQDMSVFDDMMATGMTHAGITFRPTSSAEESLSYLENQGYELALGMAPGFYSWGGLDELVFGNDDSKFLNAPCLDCDICDNWNAFEAANDPSYTGGLWQNTLTNTENVVARAKADVVFYDVEIWYDPSVLEWYYNNGDPGQDCNCNVVEDGIGYAAYRDAWFERGWELRDIVHNHNNQTPVYYYQELPENAVEWYPDYQGNLISRTEGYMQTGSGDHANPSLYVLPNLEAFEENMAGMDLTDAVAWVSYNYVYGYSNYNGGYVYFDPSVSYEAGVLLRQEGAKGFIVYPHANDLIDVFPLADYSGYDGYTDLNGYGGYDYWLRHAQAMVQGFLDGEDYVNPNKISNPSFEAFKLKADGYNGQLTGDKRKIPNFWTWTDSNPNHDDTSAYANLTFVERDHGVYGWHHSRDGQAGMRMLTSRTFTISAEESGAYDYSIWLKAQGDGLNRIRFTIANINTPDEYVLGDVYFSELVIGMTHTASTSLPEGSYELTILLEDNGFGTVAVYFDDVSLFRQ
jgi:hypothetical protein